MGVFDSTDLNGASEKEREFIEMVDAIFSEELNKVKITQGGGVAGFIAYMCKNGLSDKEVERVFSYLVDKCISDKTLTLAQLQKGVKEGRLGEELEHRLLTVLEKK